MINPTGSVGETARAQVEVFVVQQRSRPTGGAIPARYAVTVIPMDDGGRWWPHVRIADDSGDILKDAGSTFIRFSTRTAAEHAGWSFVEAWIRCRAPE